MVFIGFKAEKPPKKAMKSQQIGGHFSKKLLLFYFLYLNIYYVSSYLGRSLCRSLVEAGRSLVEVEGHVFRLLLTVSYCIVSVYAKK